MREKKEIEKLSEQIEDERHGRRLEASVTGRSRTPIGRSAFQRKKKDGDVPGRVNRDAKGAKIAATKVGRRWWAGRNWETRSANRGMVRSLCWRGVIADERDGRVAN